MVRMQELAPFVKDLAIMLGIASIVVLLFQKIRQPVVLGYIIAGIIVGPHTLPYSLVTDSIQLHTLSELGVIFLMFAIGLDFSFHKLKTVGFAAIVTGIIKIVVVAIFGFYLGGLLKLSMYESLFFGAALSISSTTIIVKALEDLGLKGQRFTDIVFGVLIIEDLLAVLMLTSLSTVLTTNHLFSLQIAWALVKLILVVGSWFVIGYFIVPIFFRKIIKYVSHETLTIVSIALCLSLAVIAGYFHYSSALGAFIMGSILAETPLAKRIQQLTAPLRDLFAAVFFVAVGMMIDLRGIFDNWHTMLWLSAAIMAVRIGITVVGIFLSGQSLNTAVRAGFSMAPVGEFSFIIMGAGMALGVVSAGSYQAIVGMALITTMIAPYLIKLSKVITKKLDSCLSERTKYLLESYSAWVYRVIVRYNKQISYRKFITKLVGNGVVVAVIFYLIGTFALVYIRDLIPNFSLAKTCGWILAFLLSATSIWGMSSSYRLIDRGRNVAALFLCWAVTLLEIIFLSVIYFSSIYIPVTIFFAMLILFILSYKNLEHSYRWLERHLKHMMRKKQTRLSKYEELAPWDTHLVELTVMFDGQDTLVGKTLEENRLRERFGINVVAIRRGSRVILTPKGEEVIYLGDDLIVLGNDDQIEAMKKIVEDKHDDLRRADVLKDFVLHAILLDEHSRFVGKSIRDSQIREQARGLVVGLERRGFRRLNPDPATVLREGDFLLIVGRSVDAIG